MSSHRILKTKPMDGLNFVLPNLVRFVCSWGRSPPYADPVYLFWNFWHTENVFACKSLMHHDEHAIFLCWKSFKHRFSCIFNLPLLFEKQICPSQVAVGHHFFLLYSFRWVILDLKSCILLDINVSMCGIVVAGEH